MEYMWKHMFRLKSCRAINVSLVSAGLRNGRWDFYRIIEERLS